MAKSRDRTRQSTAVRTTPADRSAARTTPAGRSAPVPESKLAANRADREAARATRESERRRTLIRGGIVGGVAVGLVALIVLVASPGDDLGQSQRNEGTGHLPDGTALTFANRPPSSGRHYASRAPYGLSTTPLDPGHWVHVLEHGGVVVLYKCDGASDCEQKGTELRIAVYDQAKAGKFGARKITITPYQEMDAPITAVAWNRILPQQTLDADAILAFYNRYLDRGPEDAA